jgi:hypothetical protein
MATESTGWTSAQCSNMGWCGSCVCVVRPKKSLQRQQCANACRFHQRQEKPSARASKEVIAMPPTIHHSNICLHHTEPGMRATASNPTSAHCESFVSNLAQYLASPLVRIQEGSEPERLLQGCLWKVLQLAEWPSATAA